jgi:UDP:flavonoid glycosyltransferase YjiC (YdhE family)
MLLGLPRSLGPLGNRLAGLALAAAPAPYDKARRRIGRSARKPRVFHGFSEIVVPRPRDWPARLSMTGYWWPATPATWQPPAGLLEFLDAGPPPVFLGFGSNGAADRALIIEATRQSGVRAVIQSAHPTGPAPGDRVGNGETNARDDKPGALAIDARLFEIGVVPHGWLFPRMAAVVHHCGAGTTAAGLRAGVPTVAVPRYTDQPFWARRLHALGAAPKPLPHRHLTADTLAAAIREAVTEPRYRHTAGALSERLATEDGAAPIIEWLGNRS